MAAFVVFMTRFDCAETAKYSTLRNGTIYTMDENNPTAQMVVFLDGRIIYAGDEAGGKRYSGGKTIDLKGAVVLPGLIDAHCHMHSLGKSLDDLNFRGRDKETIIEMVKEKVKQSPRDKWISGRGWDQNLWAEKQFPHWKDLKGTEDNPVILSRVDGHAAWVNRTALELCGITQDTPNPEGGVILRDKKGKPTGVLLDNAVELVREKIPKPTIAEIKRRLVKAMQECNRYGLTGAGDAYVTTGIIEAYKSLAEEDSMTMRVYGMLPDSADLLAEYFARGPIKDYGDGMFTVRAVKMFADGALGSRGASLFSPYSDDAGTSGIEVSSEDSIYQVTVDALTAGFQVCTHSIGDKACRAVLNAYQRAQEDCEVKDARLRVEHSQVLSLEDIPRYKESGIIASMQPTHATSDMPWAEDRLGAERIKGAYAWASLLNAGAKMAFGSDFPVEEVDPFLGIYSAVTRKNLAGEPLAGWYPEQCLTVEEAVRAFTQGAAYAQFQENDIGMIKEGMRADFTVIDRDIFTIPKEQILDTKVLITIVGGKTVFENRE